MRIGSNEEVRFATVSLNCAVHSCALNPLRVIHEHNPAVALHETLNDGPAVVGAPPIGNDKPQIEAVCIGQQLCDDRLEMLFFVEAGNDDEDRCYRASQCWLSLYGHALTL